MPAWGSPIASTLLLEAGLVPVPRGSWRDLLPRDLLSDVAGPAGAWRWSAQAAWRRWVVARLDSTPDSARGMDGAVGHTH